VTYASGQFALAGILATDVNSHFLRVASSFSTVATGNDDIGDDIVSLLWATATEEIKANSRYSKPLNVT